MTWLYLASKRQWYCINIHCHSTVLHVGTCTYDKLSFESSLRNAISFPSWLLLLHVYLHLNRFSARTGVYYMYVIKFVPSHLRDSSRTVVGHLRDLELGEGHEFKSHLELGFFRDFWCFISPFILSCLLAFLFSVCWKEFTLRLSNMLWG